MKIPSEAEVTNFQLICLGADQQIFRLDVPVHHILGVKVVDSFEQLVYEKFDTIPIKAIRLFLQNFKKVFVHEFKYKVQLALPNLKINITK